jgi:opacity protein-like surface antigen
VKFNGSEPMKKKFIYITFLILFTFNSYAGGFTNGVNLILDDKLFSFVSVGVSKLDVDASLALNTTLINGVLDKSAGVTEIGVGYKHSKRVFSTFSLQGNKLELANLYNLYGSVNYQFSTKKAKPFIGVLAGYSHLKWSTAPHQVQLNKNLTSKSPLYGLQVGVEKSIKKNLSLLVKYQYIKHNHKIEIVDNTSNISHSSEQNVLIGLQYLF